MVALLVLLTIVVFLLVDSGGQMLKERSRPRVPDPAEPAGIPGRLMVDLPQR